VDEYVCVTVRSRPGEAADAFNKRLIDFWTGMLRRWPDKYERVYAETARFAVAEGVQTRQYMVGNEIADLLIAELASAGIDYDPVDPDDMYSKYEATPPEWFQIPH
jgi:hypothetical protein